MRLLTSAFASSGLLLLIAPIALCAAEPSVYALRSIRPGPERFREMKLLTGDVIYLPGEAGEAERVPVRLVERNYDCELYRVRGGKATEKSGKLDCYELTARDGRPMYAWSHWSARNALRDAQLLAYGVGRNHLAWVNGLDLFIAEVTEPRDRLVALTDTLAAPGRLDPGAEQIRLNDIVGRGPFDGMNAIHNDITVLRIDSDENGIAAVVVHGVKKEDVFTFVRVDGKWQLDK